MFVIVLLYMVFIVFVVGAIGVVIEDRFKRTAEAKRMRRLEGVIMASTVILSLLAMVRGAVWLSDNDALLWHLWYQNLYWIMNIGVVAFVLFWLVIGSMWFMDDIQDRQKIKNDETEAVKEPGENQQYQHLGNGRVEAIKKGKS